MTRVRCTTHASSFPGKTIASIETITGTYRSMTVPIESVAEGGVAVDAATQSGGIVAVVIAGIPYSVRAVDVLWDCA